MNFKLKDLIGWGKAKANIYLDALKSGINPDNLENQLLLREELFELDVLRDLRMPELMDWLNASRMTPEYLGLAEIVKDIKARKPKRKLVIEAKESNFINRYEAEISIEEKQDGIWKRVQSSYPGFLIANNKAELTIDDEINRTTHFLRKRYLPDLVEKEFKPAEYQISRIKATKVRQEKSGLTADIEVEIRKINPGIKYASAQEYWQKSVEPLLQSRHASAAQKKIAIGHFQRELANAYPQSNTILDKVQKTMLLLNRMLDKQLQERKEYAKIFTQVESDNSRINDKPSISVEGLLEKYADYQTFRDLYDHDINNKFYTEPFSFKIEKTKVKVE